MSTLEEFAARIRNELYAADRPTGPSTADAMERLKGRMGLFRAAAARVLDEIVRPRVRTLASFFPNAVPPRKTEPLHCTWLFGYCERFPASVKLDFDCGHDEELNSLHLAQELFITPSFARYDRFDRLEQPLDRVDDEVVTRWVEERLSAALHAYLHVETTDRRQEQALSTDPVCGMRVIKDQAAATHDFQGLRYFFCATGCRDEFAADPERYVKLQPEY